jgi:hypothetical protein
MGAKNGIGVVEEAVRAAGVEVCPDDLAHGVDAVCAGAEGGKGNVEGGVHAAA